MRATPWLVAIWVVLFLAMKISSVGAGRVLWPPTDAIEYASMATWMAHGEGPVQRIGPAFFPARVPPTLSVLLLPQALSNGANALEYHQSIFVLATLAIAAFWRLCIALGLSKRGALTAAAVLALAPGFACYSGIVMSDVPALLFLILTLLAAERALDQGASARWSLVALGFSSGLLVAFRLTNVIWIAALAAFWWISPERNALRARWLAVAALAWMLPVALLATWQSLAFGSLSMTGYDVWHDHPRIDPIRAWSENAPASLRYYVTELAGLRSAVGGGRLGWKSDLHTLPVAVLGCVGIAGLLGRRPRGSPGGTVLRAALASCVASLALVLCFANPRFRDWRYLLPWSLLSACGAGFALDQVSAAIADRRLRVGWLHPCAVLTIGVAFLLPLPLPSPGKRLAAWTRAVEEERERLAMDASPERIRETRLPLALASLLAPRSLVFVPSRNGDSLGDVHLAIIRQFQMQPLRVDVGFESAWRDLARPRAVGHGRSQGGESAPPTSGPATR